GIPDLAFHLVGFTGDGRYYQQCRRFAEENGLSNVTFHPDAPFEEMRALLQSSRYFLHTLVNEPFGLTAVQAVAAGCIPIVHDSGGQCETVPIPDLRYQALAEVPAMIEQLEAADRDGLRRRLQQHAAEHFDESVFKGKMSEVLALQTP
ncbi:MAG: glycosyltransferase, partial [Chloroflexota bacterium]